MKRLEIVMNQAVEEDFLLMCRKKKLANAFTKYTDVCGRGNQEPKEGTPIWPQLNISFVIVCSLEEFTEYKNIIEQLRIQFPKDGIFATVSEVKLV